MGCNQILDRYIEQLIETSTPQAPAWNIEKLRAGKENTWNYIDGCMIKALIELYEITGEQRYLTFADDYIDFFVQEDGTIKHYTYTLNESSIYITHSGWTSDGTIDLAFTVLELY